MDGFHVANAGRLAVGQPCLVPCTPLGCLMLLKARLGALAGLEAVGLGRSNIVGKPMAQLLLAEHCTVTLAHSRTRQLPQVVRRADIGVVAIGQPQAVRADWLKPGCNRAARGSSATSTSKRPARWPPCAAAGSPWGPDACPRAALHALACLRL